MPLHLTDNSIYYKSPGSDGEVKELSQVFKEDLKTRSECLAYAPFDPKPIQIRLENASVRKRFGLGGKEEFLTVGQFIPFIPGNRVYRAELLLDQKIKDGIESTNDRLRFDYVDTGVTFHSPTTIMNLGDYSQGKIPYQGILDKCLRLHNATHGMYTNAGIVILTHPDVTTSVAEFERCLGSRKLRKMLVFAMCGPYGDDVPEYLHDPARLYRTNGNDIYITEALRQYYVLRTRFCIHNNYFLNFVVPARHNKNHTSQLQELRWDRKVKENLFLSNHSVKFWCMPEEYVDKLDKKLLENFHKKFNAALDKLGIRHRHPEFHNRWRLSEEFTNCNVLLGKGQYGITEHALDPPERKRWLPLPRGFKLPALGALNLLGYETLPILDWFDWYYAKNREFGEQVKKDFISYVNGPDSDYPGYNIQLTEDILHGG